MVLPADVENMQSNLGFASPEVLAHLTQPDNDMPRGEISFQAQDCWSLGCVLVWLLIGTDPFTLYRDECLALGLHLRHHGHDYSEYVSGMHRALSNKQAAWVSSSLCCLKPPSLCWLKPKKGVGGP